MTMATMYRSASHAAIAAQYAGKLCTLNGAPARVVGRLLRFAHVATLDYRGPDEEYTWEQVQRIMSQEGGRFQF